MLCLVAANMGRIVRDGVADVIQPDVCYIGGITRAGRLRIWPTLPGSRAYRIGRGDR
jgi:hypothetical protein